MTVDYNLWLQDENALPVVLFVVTPTVAGVPTPLYGATRAFRSGATDTPAHTAFRGEWKIDTQFSEALALEVGGEASVAYGSVEISNADRAYDVWFSADYVFAGCPLQIYLGDERWAFADFHLDTDGVVADNPDSRDYNVVNLKLRDKMERLNGPVSDHKLGGSTPNKDAIIPRGFGELHNVPPLLVDPNALVYQFNDGAVEPCTNAEVRDEGAPVVATIDNTTGKLTLAAAPVGTVTVSAAGDKFGGVYASTVAAVIQRLVTGFGPAPFSTSELDTDNFAAFDSAHPQAIGLYLSESANLRDTCKRVADTLAAQLAPSRLSKLRLLQVALPPPGAVTDLPEAWVFENTLRIVARPPVKAACKLGFCQNWTEQDNPKAALPPAHADLYATKWWSETAVDPAVQAAYKLSADVAQDDTLLIHRTEAIVEAQRRRDLWKVQRTVFEFTGKAPCLQLELGDAVRLYHSWFNLSAGALGMVVGLTRDLETRQVKVQVLV